MIESTRITYIYGLYELGKDEIRYIGKSDNPFNRIRSHINDKSFSHKSCWIKSVVKNDGKICLKIVSVIPYDKWKEMEVYYISEYRKKNDLVNYTSGGDGFKSNIYYKTYHECKEWLSENKPIWVESRNNYVKWSKMGDFPKFLPIAPNSVFIDWKSWGDYLGTGTLQVMKRKENYLSYEESKKYLKENYNIKNSLEYRKITFPYFISSKPYRIYSNWKGWEDYLGYKSNIRRNIQYLDYESAKKWVKENLDIKSGKDYMIKSRDENFPIFLPRKPCRVYKDFKWSYFLEHLKNKKPNDFYMKYEDSIKIVHSLKFKNTKEWREWCKNKTDDLIKIPSSPDKVYKDKWTNWYIWLNIPK